MSQFKIEVRYTFDGYFVIEANSKDEAMQTAKDSCGALLHIDSTSEAQNWDFPIHPTDEKILSVKSVKK